MLQHERKNWFRACKMGYYGKTVYKMHGEPVQVHVQ